MSSLRRRQLRAAGTVLSPAAPSSTGVPAHLQRFHPDDWVAPGERPPEWWHRDPEALYGSREEQAQGWRVATARRRWAEAGARWARRTAGHLGSSSA